MTRAIATASALVLATLGVANARQGSGQPVFRGGTELVLVNVVVRDKSGAVVRGLTRDDFTVSEDDRPQTITSFDFEELDRGPAATVPDLPQAVLPAKLPSPPPAASVASATGPKIDMRGRRLIVLFFDLSSMQPEELSRAARAAHDYVDAKLSPNDLVAVASFSTALSVNQDFTADREQLSGAIDAFGGAGAAGFDAGSTGDTEDTPDTGGAFVADDTEFNVFSTDRRLQALQSLSDALSGIEQKKSIVYFSSGMSQSGTDNQVQLRRTIDRAKRANVSIYAADMRGLQAQVPGGDATTASRRGTSPFSGASVRNQFDQTAASQDTLLTIAEDTGGRAFFDVNSFGGVFDRVVADTSVYYVLGYTTTNPAQDGRFRRIKVSTRRKDAKLEYRSGYYAARDFGHSSKEDREQQLQDQLTSDLSATDLATYVSTAYFRLADNRYYVPISVVVPGNQIPPLPANGAAATIDVLGLVRDAQGRPIGRVRDTVRLSAAERASLRTKTVQYQTGLEMPPGKYHLKFVVRENDGGTFGAYETDAVVPDVRQAPVKVSSVVLGTRLEAAGKGSDHNPLLRDGRELIPNVTHVVSAAQHLYFYYEVYEPTAPVHIVSSVAFYRGRIRVFETPALDRTELSDPARRSAVFRLDVPASSLKPGLYTCQINVIDDTGGKFAFPRLKVYVRP